uniref:C2H2-type domain-containing protein n=1 Tax=Glossina morsitans morsitans TaxID=37546 RepID=A0A1B0GF66_GLOMM
MVRSRRSISKEDASSVLTDSGISLSSPSSNQTRFPSHHHLSEDEEEAILNKLFVTDEENTIQRTTDDPTVSKRSIEKVVGSDSEDNQLAAEDKRNGKDEKENKTEINATVAQNDCKPVVGAPAGKRSRKSYVCEVCNKEFGGNTDLKRHQLIHSDEKPFKCEQCGKCYRQAINLKNHITTAHARKKQYSCDQCPKTFALKERLKLHMRLHSGEKPYACSQCDKRFARGGQLHQHTVSHHQDAPKKFKCEKCSTRFSTSSNLKAHLERHEHGPEHYCNICNEHFVNEVLLKTHVAKTHYKLKQVECEVCKQTIEEEDLATHMKTHANVKSHVCEVCHSMFMQKSQYNVHMRMHTGERPYQCQVCCQTFAHSSVLKLHIRKHTGEKPFNCLLCKDDEVAFSQLAHLKTHMKKIHNQFKPYMCEGCHEFFKVKIELEAHQHRCDKCTSNLDEQDARYNEAQILSHIRFHMAILLKKISSNQKLQQLGFEKRLIDNVIMASLKLAKRKVHDDPNLTPIERMRLNVQELLNWIVPIKVMETFREEKLSVENILEKIVTMYMKQK